MTKILIIGPYSSGKSRLRLVLAGDIYTQPKSTIAVDFSQFNIENNPVFLEEHASVEYESIDWSSNIDAIFFCINLRADYSEDLLRQDAANIKKIKIQNPESTLHLVGTFGDEASDAQRTLEAIQGRFTKLGINFENASVVTLPPGKVSHDEVDDLRKTMILPLLPPKPAAKNATVQTPFPTSYDQLWEKGMSSANENQNKAFHGALAILKDYSKSNQPNTCSIFGHKIKLFFSFHQFRHHTNVVDALYKQHYNADNMTAGSLIDALKEKLMAQGETLNLKGSLAQRIRFIEKQAGLPPTPFNELNYNIQATQVPELRI